MFHHLSKGWEVGDNLAEIFWLGWTTNLQRGDNKIGEVASEKDTLPSSLSLEIATVYHRGDLHVAIGVGSESARQLFLS